MLWISPSDMGIFFGGFQASASDFSIFWKKKKERKKKQIPAVFENPTRPSRTKKSDISPKISLCIIACHMSACQAMGPPASAKGESEHSSAGRLLLLLVFRITRVTWSSRR
jgi:hypothetical protein